MKNMEKINWKTERFNKMLEQYAEDLNYSKELDEMLWAFIRESSIARSYPSHIKGDFEEAAYAKLTNILLGIDLRKHEKQLSSEDLKKKLKTLIRNGNGLGGYLRVHLAYVSVKFRKRLLKEDANFKKYVEKLRIEVQNEQT